MTAPRLIVVVLFVSSVAFAQAGFYSDHLQRGIDRYNRGDYAAAVGDLRIAAFGLLDSPPEYATALKYQILADQKLGLQADADEASRKLAHAEAIARAMATPDPMLRLGRGDEAGARAAAEQLLPSDYTNAAAHTVLGLIAARHSDWNGVIEHYSVVRTRRRLTNDENAAFYIALVRTGRTADAAGVRRLLSPAALAIVDRKR